MALKDLSGKTVYDLEPEDFEMLFCQLCEEKVICTKDEEKINSCRILADSGFWDKHYRDK